MVTCAQQNQVVIIYGAILKNDSATLAKLRDTGLFHDEFPASEIVSIISRFLKISNISAYCEWLERNFTMFWVSKELLDHINSTEASANDQDLGVWIHQVLFERISVIMHMHDLALELFSSFDLWNSRNWKVTVGYDHVIK